MWRQMNIYNSFTLEATFSGTIIDKWVLFLLPLPSCPLLFSVSASKHSERVRSLEIVTVVVVIDDETSPSIKLSKLHPLECWSQARIIVQFR